MDQTLEYIQKHFPAIITIGLFVLGIWLTKRRSQRAISYQFVKNVPIVTRNPAASPKLKSTYEGREVEKVRVIELKLRNCGAPSVDEKDFIEPLTITFSPNIEIFDVQISKRFPDTFKPEIEVGETSITVQPILMMPKEFLIVTITAAATQPNTPLLPDVTARIRDGQLRPIGKIRQASLDLTAPIAYISLICMVGAIVIAALVATLLNALGKPIHVNGVVSSICTTAVILLVLFFSGAAIPHALNAIRKKISWLPDPVED